MSSYHSVFLFLTSVTARIMHHYTSVDFTLNSLFVSVSFQTAISVFWSIIAVVIMTAASRMEKRRVWQMGSLLLFLVAAKLFLADMFLSSAAEQMEAFL